MPTMPVMTLIKGVFPKQGVIAGTGIFLAGWCLKDTLCEYYQTFGRDLPKDPPSSLQGEWG